MNYHCIYHGEDPFWPAIILRVAPQWLPTATDRLEIHTSGSVADIEQWIGNGFPSALPENRSNMVGYPEYAFSRGSVVNPKPIVVWRHHREELDLLVEAIWRVNRGQTALQFLILPEYFPILSKEAREIGLGYQELGISCVLQLVTDLTRITGLVRGFWQV